MKTIINNILNEISKLRFKVLDQDIKIFIMPEPNVTTVRIHLCDPNFPYGLDNVDKIPYYRTVFNASKIIRVILEIPNSAIAHSVEYQYARLANKIGGVTVTIKDDELLTTFALSKKFTLGAVSWKP